MNILKIDYSKHIETDEKLGDAIDEVVDKTLSAKSLIGIALDSVLKEWESEGIDQLFYKEMLTLLSAAEDHCEVANSIAEAIGSKEIMLKEK